MVVRFPMSNPSDPLSKTPCATSSPTSSSALHDRAMHLIDRFQVLALTRPTMAQYLLDLNERFLDNFLRE